MKWVVSEFALTAIVITCTTDKNSLGAGRVVVSTIMRHANRSESDKLRKVDLQTERYRKNLLWVREIKAKRQCVVCGVSDYRVLHFDHLSEHEEAISITDALRKGYSKQRMLQEMTKCEVICANCRSIRTFDKKEMKTA